MFRKIFKPLMFVSTLLMIIISSFGRVIFSSDELWNFMNILKITKNFTSIYSDANIIITPIFFVISSIVFKIISPSIIVFRILNIIIKYLIFLLMYKVLKKVTKDDLVSLSASSLYIALIVIVDNGANYNELVMIFVLIGVILYLNKNNDSLKFSILHGINIFLIFMTKQNIAVYYILAVIIIDIIITRNKRKAFLKLSIKALTFMTLILITMLLLKYINILDNFINYCFLGIGNFTNNFRIGFNILEIIKYLMIVLSFVFLIAIYLKKNKDVDSSPYIILCVTGLFMFGYIFPLINNYHLAIGALVYYLFIVSTIYTIFKDIIGKKVEVIICIISFVALFSFIIKNIIVINSRKDILYTENELYLLRYSYIEENVKDEIYYLNNYINLKRKDGIDIRIFSDKSCYRYIYDGISFGIYDLPFDGNFGKLTYDEILKILIDNHDSLLIISKEGYEFHQEPKAIYDIIRNTYEKVDEFYDLEVYYIN